MTRSHGALFICIVLSATASNTSSAEPNWVGEYADKKFLNGQAIFQMSIEQSGNAIQVSFDAAYNDGHGAAPDGQGPEESPPKTRWSSSGKMVSRILELAGLNAQARTSSCR